MFSLAGKHAYVTGGGRGIGAAIALGLAKAGAQVSVGYRTRRADADAVVAACVALGPRAVAIAGDLTDASSVDASMREAVAALGPLDIVVHSAGIWPVDDTPVGAMESARWDRTRRENIDAMFYVARTAATQLRDGGRLVMIASTAGQRGEAMHADYAASKGAMISFVKSLCIELAPRGITVNAVAPGWVDTEMCAEPFAGGGKERIAKTIPVGRVASPADIAFPVVCLCADEARHVTGEIVNVNGGSVLCG